MKVCLCTVSADSVDDIIDVSVRALGELPIPPKTAISSLIESMIKNGFDNYSFYDIDMLVPSDNEIKDYFKKNAFDVVGLSAVVSSSYPQVLRIAKIIRELAPETCIVLGGNLCAISDIVMKKTEVDLCFVGEGEVAWIEFLKYYEKNNNLSKVEQLKKIKGLCFLSEEKELIFTGYGMQIDADELPLANYEILKEGLGDKPELVNNYFRLAKDCSWFKMDDSVIETDYPYIAHFNTSKGCTAKCTFCQRSIGGYRVYNLDKIEEHIIYLKDKYKVGYLSIFDENFGSNIKHTHKLAELFKKHNIFWIASGVRCTNVTKEDLAFYKNNNCLAMKFGVESGSQNILDIMEKKFSREQVVEALTSCIDLKIYSPLALMLGMPGETDKTVKETAQLIGNISHMLGIEPENMGYDLMYLMTFPGTPTYVYAQKVGIIGSSLNEEIEYLSNISQPIGTKYGHINLSGASIKDLVFWDYLIKLESHRVFTKLNNKYGKKDIDIIYKKMFRHIEDNNHNDDVKVEVVKSSRLSRIIKRSKVLIKEKRFLKEVLFKIYRRNYIFDYLLRKGIFSKIPAFILYPILKNIIYVKYVVFKSCGSFSDLITRTNQKLSNDYFETDKRKKKSLRECLDINNIKSDIQKLRLGK